MPEIMRKPSWSQSINHQAFFFLFFFLSRKTFTDEQFKPFLIPDDIGETLRQHAVMVHHFIKWFYTAFKQ